VREKEKGYVGAVKKVNTALLEVMMDAGFIPVIAPIGMNSGVRGQGDPAMLNYNADVVAGEIAAALCAEKLLFLTDVDGVSDSESNLIPEMTAKQARALIKSGVASGGMIPKINACLKALTGEAGTRIIDGRRPHALLEELSGGSGGTTIR
jgi:acetylglutamate kinase